MTPDQVRQIVQEEIKKSAQQAQYSVTRVPVHTHNGLDSSNLPPHSVQGFNVLTGTPQGIANPALLKGTPTVTQYIAFGEVPDFTTTTPNIYVYPIPIIVGSGTTTPLTLTGTPAKGATSATLTGNWVGASGAYASLFVNGEVRTTTLTNGATTVTWSYPLQFAGGGPQFVVLGNAAFHGGLAPNGTLVIFRNDDDGVFQLWVRSTPPAGIFIESWWAVDMDPRLVD